MGLNVMPGQAGSLGASAWQSLLRDSAGSAAKNLLSAPLGYGVSALFKMLVPDAQTTALQEVGAIVRRIEDGVTQGMAQIEDHLAHIESGIDQGFRQLTAEVFALRLSGPLDRITYFANRVCNEPDFRIDATHLVELDLSVEAVCGALLHAPLSSQQHGFLASAASALQGAFKAGSFASLDLVRAAEAFSARFSSGLMAALRGLTLVEAALAVGQGAPAAQARRQRFVAQQLPGLLDAYRQGVEAMVLAALDKAPTDARPEDATRWRELLDCCFHVLRQADLTVVGAACHLSGAAVPAVWLSGRVIGTARAVAWGQQRLASLQAQVPGVSALPALAGLGAITVVRHAAVRPVMLSARGLAPGGPPRLIEPEDSGAYLLRYALTGFDEAFVKALDELAAAADGLAMCPLSLRGQPALGRIASHALAFDPVFQNLQLDFADAQALPATRHLGELALALPLPLPPPPLPPSRAPRAAPWRLDAGLDAVCRHQLADAAQQAWNRAHAQAFSPAASAPATRTMAAPAAKTAEPAVKPLYQLPAQPAQVTALALSHDGRTLACGLADGQITLWALPDAVPQRTLAKAHTGAVRALVFTDNDASLVSASDDTTVGVWSLSSGLATFRLTHHGTPVTALAPVPGLNQVFSVGREGIYRIDPVAGTAVRTPAGGDRSAAFASATADPGVYACGDVAGQVHLFGRDSGQVLPDSRCEDLAAEATEATRAQGAVTALCFPPGAQRMVLLTGPAGRAQVWDLRGRRFLHGVGSADFRPGHALWQDDGHQVLLADADGRLQLCDLATGAVLCEGRGPAPLGALLAATGGTDGWWLAGGGQVACWPALRLPQASTPTPPAAPATPATPADASQALPADLAAWLEAAEPAPADLLDARGVVSVHSRHPDARRDARLRRRASQWLLLSTCTGHTLSWHDDPANDRAWPALAADLSVHADGPPLPWVAGEPLSAAATRLRDADGAHLFFRAERVGYDRITLQTAQGLYVAVDGDGVVRLVDDQGAGALLQPLQLEGGQLALRDDRGRWLTVPQPGGRLAPHDTRTVILDTPRLATLTAAESASQPDPAPGEACRFTLHFAEPAITPQPAWTDGSVLDAWHRHTAYFTDAAMSGFDGHGESRSWHGELVRRQAAGRAGLTTAGSAAPVRLKVEVWGERRLVSGDLDRSMGLALGTVKFRVCVHLAVSGQAGQPPGNDAFHAIRDLPFEVDQRWQPEAGSKKEPPVTNGPPEAGFYASGEVELQHADAVWLRVTTELREDWWTRQPNSWATLGVRLRDVRLSWA